jgi:uncharacterized protein (TIGR02284 family)
MVTTVGTEDTLEDLLTDLVQLDFDAAAAYQAAIDRLDNATYKSALTEFREDHLRHTRELGECLRSLGKAPPTQGDAKEYLAKGKVVIGGLAGDDAILRAMQSNEDDTVTAYDRAVGFKDVPENVLDILERGDEDEHRHCEWIRSTLKAS